MLNHFPPHRVDTAWARRLRCELRPSPGARTALETDPRAPLPPERSNTFGRARPPALAFPVTLPKVLEPSGGRPSSFFSTPRSPPSSHPYAPLLLLVPALPSFFSSLRSPPSSRPYALRGDRTLGRSAASSLSRAPEREPPAGCEPAGGSGQEAGVGRGSVRITAPTQSVGASITSDFSSRPRAPLLLLVPTLCVGTGLLAAPRPLLFRARRSGNLPRVANPREVRVRRPGLDAGASASPPPRRA